MQATVFDLSWPSLIKYSSSVPAVNIRFFVSFAMLLLFSHITLSHHVVVLEASCKENI